MTANTDTEFLIGQIERSVAEASPFDLSPRGVRFRPDADLSGRIERLAALGDPAATALADRLGRTDDPLLAIAWLYCLRQINTAASQKLFAAAVEGMRHQDRWVGRFPGLREILLFAGGED